MSSKQPPGRTIVDPVFQTLVNLCREVWVLKDRQLVLEQILKDHDIDPDLIENMQPDGDLKKRIDEERVSFLERVMEPYNEQQ